MKKLRKLSAKRLEDCNKIWLGTGVLLAAAALIAALLTVKQAGFGHGRYRAEFLQAAQIREGDLVAIAGISVGTVKAVDLAGDKVVVDFTVRDDLELPEDTRAAIKMTALLGGRYLELTPSGKKILAHNTIPIERTTVPYDLQKTLADATTTFDAVDAGKLRESIDALSQGLGGVPDALPQALQNVKSLADAIGSRREQIGSLLKSTNDLTTVIRNQKANLGTLVIRGESLLSEIVKRREAVKKLFAGTTSLIAVVTRILKDAPGMNKTLTALRDFVHMIASQDALLRNILQSLPVPLRNIANATGSSTAVDLNVPAGFLADSWMCAISGRAKQFNMVEYFKDCQ